MIRANNKSQNVGNVSAAISHKTFYAQPCRLKGVRSIVLYRCLSFRRIHKPQKVRRTCGRGGKRASVFTDLTAVTFRPTDGWARAPSRTTMLSDRPSNGDGNARGPSVASVVGRRAPVSGCRADGLRRRRTGATRCGGGGGGPGDTAGRHDNAAAHGYRARDVRLARSDLRRGACHLGYINQRNRARSAGPRVRRRRVRVEGRRRFENAAVWRTIRARPERAFAGGPLISTVRPAVRGNNTFRTARVHVYCAYVRFR